MSELWKNSISDSDTRESALRKAEKITNKREREKAIASWCWAIFRELETAKYTIAGTNQAYWNRLLDQCDGAQVPDRGDGRPKPKYNLTRQLIEEEKTVFADVGVNIEVHPRQPDDMEKASVIQDHLDYAMDEVKITELDRRGSNWMLKLGTMIPMTTWDPFANDGLGGLKTTIIDPRKFYPSPGATDIESCWAIGTIDTFDTDDLVRKYPKRKDDILKAFSDAGSETRRGNDQKMENLGRPKKVLQLIYRDPVTDKDSSIDTDGAPGKPLYPDGRVFTVIGDLVLRDAINPNSKSLGGHGQYPFTSAQNIDRHDTLFGRGNAEILDAGQNELDVLETMISNWSRVASNTYIEMTNGTKFITQNLSNLPLKIIKVKKGGSFNFRQLPPLPEHTYGRAATLEARMRKELGGGELDVTAITKRNQPVGTMQIAQETLEKRPRAKIDNKNRCWAAWAKQALAILRQRLTTARIIRLSSGRTVRVDPEILKNIDIEQFDIRIVPTGRTVYSRALSYAIINELDKAQVLGPVESLRRRRLLAETAGVKGVMQLLADEERETAEQAEMQAMMEQLAAQEEANTPPAPPGAPPQGPIPPELGGAAIPPEMINPPMPAATLSRPISGRVIPMRGGM